MTDEPEKAPAGRDKAGKFLPGVSGNPNGDGKQRKEIAALAREYGPEAVERLVHWLRCDDPQASIPAAKLLLERGYGKNIQPIRGEGGPLVNINIGREPLRDVVSAAATYAAILGDPSIDIASITFEAPRPAQRVEQVPPVEVPYVEDSIVAGGNPNRAAEMCS